MKNIITTALLLIASITPAQAYIKVSSGATGIFPTGNQTTACGDEITKIETELENKDSSIDYLFRTKPGQTNPSNGYNLHITTTQSWMMNETNLHQETANNILGQCSDYFDTVVFEKVDTDWMLEYK